MHAFVLLCINQYTEFEMPSFINYTDMIEAIWKNGSRDADHAPFRGGLSQLARIWYSVQNLKILALGVSEISLGRQKGDLSSLYWDLT